MILLDTNVVSALMRLPQEPLVAAWFARQNPVELYTSTLTVFEMSFGLEMLPVGQRRSALEQAFAHVIGTTLGNRVLAFDTRAAFSATRVRSSQQRRGINAEVPDNQIAGIAVSLNIPVATRNTADFSNLGLVIVDPWQAGP